MPYRLDRLSLSDMTELGGALRRMGRDVKSLDELATAHVRLLRSELTDEHGKPACPLVRFYRTIRHGDLDPELQAFGASLMKGHTLEPDTRCLTLIATVGESEGWSSCRSSRRHRTIPLPSAAVVSSIPMISQLLVQLGVDVHAIVRPDPSFVLEAEQRTYNVFYVADAVGSPFIPDQPDFVVAHGIRSVIGFGGLLPNGDVYATLLFTRVLVDQKSAELFRNAAMNTKLALLPFCVAPATSPSHGT